MGAFQNKAWETNLYLAQNGIPATGILYSQVLVKYKKAGQTAFTVRPLNLGELVELGSGFYALSWPALYLDTLGTLLYTISGAGFNNFLYDTFDVDPVPVSLAYVPPTQCMVLGNITDIGGNPARHRTVSFYPPEFPVIVGSSVVDADKIYTTPDALGNFSVMLLQGQTVIVEIERTGIRVQITIPVASSANLTDLLPPL